MIAENTIEGNARRHKPASWWHYTPEGLLYDAAKKSHLFGMDYNGEIAGEIAGEVDLMGISFLQRIKNTAKAIGKVTSPFTTMAAKAFLPASLVDAAAKLDPSKKGTVTQASLTAAANALVMDKLKTSQGLPAKTGFFTPASNKMLIPAVIAAAGLVTLVIINKRKKVLPEVVL